MILFDNHLCEDLQLHPDIFQLCPKYMPWSIPGHNGFAHFEYLFSDGLLHMPATLASATILSDATKSYPWDFGNPDGYIDDMNPFSTSHFIDS